MNLRNTSALGTAQNQTSSERHVNAHAARAVRDVVESAVRIRVFVVDRRQRHLGRGWRARKDRLHCAAQHAGRCPVIDLAVELTASLGVITEGRLRAKVSALSPSGVQVACALT